MLQNIANKDKTRSDNIAHRFKPVTTPWIADLDDRIERLKKDRKIHFITEHATAIQSHTKKNNAVL